MNKESLPPLDLGKPNIKSIEISTHSEVGIGSEVYNLLDETLDLAILQTKHLSKMEVASIFAGELASMSQHRLNQSEEIDQT
ncbi:hypothetical protein CR513_55851, partial [Mucuna pruriens]